MTKTARIRETHDLATRAIAHLRRIVNVIHSQSAKIETALGLTGPQLWTLREVTHAEHGISLGEIAGRLALHKATAGRIVERLVEKDLVVCTRPAYDRRVTLVAATAKGRSLAHAPVANPAQADLLTKFESFDRARMKKVERVLAGIVTLLGAESVPLRALFEDAPATGKRARR